MAAQEQHPRRVSYLLRLWSISDAQGVRWRALLEDPMTGQRIGFPDVQSLAEFLLSLTREAHLSLGEEDVSR